jgi:DNA-binding response OmpR family regulator
MSIFDRLLGSVRKQTDRPDATPVAPAAPVGPIERRKRKRVDARKGTRALIIDDSATVVAALRKVLRSAGFETQEAMDAEQGLSLIEQHPPELIFLDIILPGMNGFNALRTIRRSPVSQHIPVIMISGNEHATEQFYADRIGADDFMKKPFSRHEIFARIEALLGEDRIPRRKHGATAASPRLTEAPAPGEHTSSTADDADAAAPRSTPAVP